MAGAFLAIGTTWYWLARKQNAVDWDVGGWRSRFTRSAFRYDNNAYPINFVYHPMSGAAFYTFARANEVGILASAAYAVGTSFAWEFAIDGASTSSVPATAVTMNDGEALAVAAGEGLGLAQLPIYMAEDGLRTGSLVEVLRPFRPPALPIALVYPSSRQVTPRLRVLIEALTGTKAARGAARRSTRAST